MDKARPISTSTGSIEVDLKKEAEDSLVGPTGPKGEKGDIGPTGPKGEDGAKGDCGERGERGPEGCTGPKGDRGEDAVVLAGTTTLVLSDEPAQVKNRYEGHTHFFDFEIPCGKQGERGDIGPTGPQGEQGERGDVGPTGPQGEKGDAPLIMAGVTTQVDENTPAKVDDRYEDEVHFLDFSIPQGKTGKQGEKGDIGPQGIQGDVGPRGEKGDVGPKGDIGPTGPQGERGETGPTGPQGETGPRGLPGEIGRAEGISIDGAETVEANEDAQVLDDFELNIHHLTFYIPRGKQGEKGDTPLIMAGNTTQVGESESAKVTDRFADNTHYLDFSIPQGKTGAKGDRGPQGPTGQQGATGPKGSTNNINATIYNSINQDISSGRPIKMDEVLTNNGMSLNESSITVPEKGTYLISFSINNGTTATAGDSIGVYKNSALLQGSKRPLTTSTNVSGTIVASLNANDTITLVPVLYTDRTLTSSGAPSAMLTVVQIAN